MKNRKYSNILLFLLLFVICLFESQTIGNSFALQGTPSGIMRLKICKSIKGFKTYNFNDFHKTKKAQFAIVVSQNRQLTGGSPNDDNTYISSHKANKYEQIVDLYRKENNTQNLRYLTIGYKQVLRI
ncbi:MAG: hypothetical protein J6U84_03520 [Bacteroidales bacterium]|jgi:hypothetical protein|nr:hypothetical protein [Bacteroidales bacterium]